MAGRLESSSLPAEGWGKLKLKQEEYPLHKEEFLIWDGPSVDEWGQPGEMGGCRCELPEETKLGKW